MNGRLFCLPLLAFTMGACGLGNFDNRGRDSSEVISTPTTVPPITPAESPPSQLPLANDPQPASNDANRPAPPVPLSLDNVFLGTMKPGTRLQVLTLRGDDNSSIQTTFFDSKLQVECTIQLAADGCQRCLPSSSFRIRTSFVDASCSTPTISFQNGMVPSTSFIYTLTSATGLPQVYRGMAVSPSLGTPEYTTKFYYTAVASNARAAGTTLRVPTNFRCGLTSWLQDAIYSSNHGVPGTVIPPSELVSFVEKIAPAGPRLSIRSYIGSDGSAQQHSFYDGQLKIPCRAARSTDGTLRCLPTSEASSLYEAFSDPQCTKTIWNFSRGGSGAGPYYVSRPETGLSCGDILPVYTGFKPLTSTQIFTSWHDNASGATSYTQNNCFASDLNYAWDATSPVYESLHQSVSPALFLPLFTADSTGSSPVDTLATSPNIFTDPLFDYDAKQKINPGARLRVVRAAVDGANRGAKASFYDTRLGVLCTPGGSTQMQRCLPNPFVTRVSYYSDSACRYPIVASRDTLSANSVYRMGGVTYRGATPVSRSGWFRLIYPGPENSTAINICSPADPNTLIIEPGCGTQFFYEPGTPLSPNDLVTFR